MLLSTVHFAAVHVIAGLGIGVSLRHFISLKFLPLTADAKKASSELTAFKQAVLAHIDGMVDRSEIMIRHDAQVLRNLIAGK